MGKTFHWMAGSLSTGKMRTRMRQTTSLSRKKLRSMHLHDLHLPHQPLDSMEGDLKAKASVQIDHQVAGHQVPDLCCQYDRRSAHLWGLCVLTMFLRQGISSCLPALSAPLTRGEIGGKRPTTPRALGACCYDSTGHWPRRVHLLDKCHEDQRPCRAEKKGIHLQNLMAIFCMEYIRYTLILCNIYIYIQYILSMVNIWYIFQHAKVWTHFTSITVNKFMLVISLCCYASDTRRWMICSQHHERLSFQWVFLFLAKLMRTKSGKDACCFWFHLPAGEHGSTPATWNLLASGRQLRALGPREGGFVAKQRYFSSLTAKVPAACELTFHASPHA